MFSRSGLTACIAAIVDAVASSPGQGLLLSEIVDRTGMSGGAVQRVAAGLVEAEFLTLDHGKRYRLGRTVARIGETALRSGAYQRAPAPPIA